MIFLVALHVGILPPVVDLSIQGGGRYKGTLTFFNRGDKGVYMKAEVKDYGIDTIDGSPIPLAFKKTPYSLSPYLSLETNFFYLPPYSQKKIGYIINIPSGLKGAYASMLLFSTSDSKGNVRGAGVDIGVNVFARINLNEEKVIIEEKDSVRVLERKGVIYFTFAIKNIGNTFVKVKDVFQIKDERGNTVYHSPIEGSTFFPPGGWRRYTYIWKPKRKGRYIGIALLEYEDEMKLIEKAFVVR